MKTERISPTMSKITKYLSDGDYRFMINSGMELYRRMPDEEFLKRIYRARMGKELRLDPPVDFNEKLQWLKLHDHDPAYHRMADKAEVKSYVAERIGEEYIIPTLGVYDSVGEIDYEALPDSFVLKCTHDSGGIVICRGKADFDVKSAEKTLGRFLKRDYYSHWREWPYKGLPHRIIAEEYLDADGGLTDYKIHCFNGEPRLVLVCRDRFSKTGMTEDFFTEEWEHIPVRRPEHPNSSAPIDRPAQLDELLRLSKELAKGIPFVRVDFYIVGERILFSEITFFPAAGLTPFEPEEWDRTFGDWLKLPSDSV